MNWERLGFLPEEEWFDTASFAFLVRIVGPCEGLIEALILKNANFHIKY
jgi:hypothetical protein